MEVNPNHPVIKETRDQWYKIAALLMMKFGVKETVITLDDIKKMPDDVVIAIDSKSNHIRLFLTDMKTALELAKKEGGMPV